MKLSSQKLDVSELDLVKFHSPHSTDIGNQISSVESLYGTLETNVTLCVNYTGIKIKSK